MRKSIVVLLMWLLAFAVFADNTKKGKKTTTPVVATSTANITASEGSTAMAIRGIVEPGEGWAVIGYTGTTFTARNRITGRIAKFTAPAGSYSLGQTVVPTHITNEWPCCSISAISGNLLTVTEPAVGRTFKLNVASANNLRVGQAVSVNFKTGIATVGSWNGPVTQLSQPAGLHP